MESITPGHDALLDYALPLHRTDAVCSDCDTVDGGSGAGLVVPPAQTLDSKAFLAFRSCAQIHGDGVEDKLEAAILGAWWVLLPVRRGVGCRRDQRGGSGLLMNPPRSDPIRHPGAIRSPTEASRHMEAGGSALSGGRFDTAMQV